MKVVASAEWACANAEYVRLPCRSPSFLLSNMPIETVCVFCGSNPGRHPDYAEAARAFGALLADRGLRLVYGGGGAGLMGALADGALERGGHVTGVMPEGLVAREAAHRGLTSLVVTRTMHERKALLAEHADAFVALPGGIGTFEELFEAWTWAGLGIHRKPVGLLNVAGYYDALAAFLDHATTEGFLRADLRGLLVAERSAAALLARLAEHRAALSTGRPWS